MNRELISNMIEFIENVDEILSSRYWYEEGIKENYIRLVTQLNRI